MKVPIVAIVGRPNIGKSTFFNRLVGRMKAIVSNVAGTTRDSVYEYVDYHNNKFLLIDTAGIEKPEKGNSIEIGMQEQAEVALETADVILFGLDGRTTLFAEDRDILKKLYKSDKPFMVFVNKVDTDSLQDTALLEFSQFADDVHFISAQNGRGVDEFLDAIVSKFEEIKDDLKHDKKTSKNHIADVALVGKPNVGKSSLLNVFIGKDEAIVSDVAGTTRDSINKDVMFNNEVITFIDTAGLRRKTKVNDEIEKFSVLRALHSVNKADVILLILDSYKGITKQDMTISQLALDNYKSVILVANKWDLVPKDQVQIHEYEEYIRHVFGYMKWVPIVFTSATEKIRTFKLLEMIKEISDCRKTEIKTSELNKSIQKYIISRPPQARNTKFRRPKIYYSVQTGTNPLEFTMFVNDPERFHSSYKRYLENRLREDYNFTGTPLKILYKKRREDV